MSTFLDLRDTRNGESRTLGSAARPGPMLAAPRLTKIDIPKPLMASADTSDAMPLVKRSDFPIAVNPENPLRFAATDRNAVTATGGDWRARDAISATITARRVVGVGPMPYERFGFKLLKGWNGNPQPSLNLLDAQAASGTAWHVEQSTLVAIKPASREASAAPEPTLASRFHP